MSWQNQLKGDSLSWLLEPDSPDVHYLALRDLVVDTQEATVLAAQKERAAVGEHHEDPVRDHRPHHHHDLPRGLTAGSPSDFWLRYFSFWQ